MSRDAGGSAVFQKYCDIIDALSDADGPLRLNELAQAAGLAKSTTHRIATVLVGEDIVIYDADQQEYQLGMRVLGWAAKTWQNMDLPRVADSVMRSLHEKTGEHSNLAIRDGTEVLFLHGTQHRHGSLTNEQIGQRAAIHCTATGKVLVAYMPDNERDQLLDELPLTAYTQLTITDRRKFVKELKDTKRNGFALANGEEFLFKSGIAAPIFDFRGRVIAAVSIYGLTYSDKIESFLAWEPDLKAAAKKISVMLGYNPDDEA